MDENLITTPINPDIDIRLVLENMARAIVDNTLHVAEEDMGMIIGKHGKIARAIRTIAKAAAKIADQKITVEIK